MKCTLVNLFGVSTIPKSADNMEVSSYPSHRLQAFNIAPLIFFKKVPPGVGYCLIDISSCDIDHFAPRAQSIMA